MPRRFLRGGITRLLLTIVAVACGVALVCAIDLANRAVYAAFVDVIDAMAGRASLVVSAGDGALVSEDVAASVRSVSGVDLAVPVVSSWAFATDGSGEQLTVHGIDVANDNAVRVYEPADASPTLDDPIVFLNHRDSVVLTTDFASRHGLKLDDSLELDTPTGRHRFVVRGLLAPQGIARVQGGNVLVMDIDAAELAFTARGLVSRIDVVVRRDAVLGDVRDGILAVLPLGLRVEAPTARRIDLQRVMGSVQTLLQAVGWFGLFSAFLIAYSRLSTVFEARVGELAILRAVGVRARRVWWELLKESMLIAVAGITLGVVAGVVLGHAVVPVIATTTAIGAKLGRTDAVVTIRAESIGLAILLGFTAVLLAALVPARRASRIPVVETLRHQYVPSGASPVGARLRVLLAAVAVSLVIVHLATGSVRVGLGASAIVVMCAAALTWPLVASVAQPLALLAPRGIGRFAAANLLRSPRRTALTVATIGIGLGTVVWLWTLARSFEQSVVEVMPGVLRGDLVVSSANMSAGYVEAPLDDAILPKIEAIPGVSVAVGEQTADWHYAHGPVALNAFDARYFDGTTFGAWRLIGRSLPDSMALIMRGQGVLISENFAHNLGERVGNLMTLETPTGPLSVRIVGIVADFLSPRGTILMSRDVYQRFWNDRHITHALVRVAPGTHEGDLRRTIERTLGERYRIRVLNLHELVDWFAEQVRRAFTGLDILAGLVIVVVLVGIGDALAAGMLERRRELGVARAIGVRRGSLGKMIVAESLFLGVMGVVVASLLGLGLGTLWVASTFPALLGWTLSLHVPFAQSGELALTALGISLVAAYLPMTRVIRLDPVEALRDE